MMFKNKAEFVRYMDSGRLAEIFLINSVLAIIAIRVFLHLTNYPTLGGEGIHIAHMLWGGFLMLIALFLLLFFLDRKPKVLAAVVGGLGFGTFIDELGKFITSDNDYFFKPTFAFIYLIFVAIFLLIRWVERSRSFTKTEYLVNAIELIKHSILEEFDKSQKRLLDRYLKTSIIDGKILKEFMDVANTVRISYKENSYVNIEKRISRRIKLLAKSGLLSKIVLWFFILRGILIVFTTVLSLFKLGNGGFTLYEISKFNFFDWGYLLSSLVVNFLIILGLVMLSSNLKRGFVFLKQSVLVSLFVFQFFAFYHQQLLALGGVLADIFVYYVLDYTQENY